MRVRFGPAGRPVDYRGDIVGVPAYLRAEGLDAFEYQAVRGVRISEAKASALREAAEANDVQLTLHAPYAINLCSTSEEKVAASIERLLAAARAASWMGARIVVFHPGYYGELSPTEALERCIEALRTVVERMESEGIRGVLLGPETTGKTSQLGSVEEVIEICKRVERTVPVVDWAHIHARGQGAINSKEDYLKVLDLIERELGSDIVHRLHCHFTKVEYGRGGERRHHTLSEEGYGPDFRPLAEIIVEHGYSFTIISESPVLDKDAILMKRILEETASSLGRNRNVG